MKFVKFEARIGGPDAPVMDVSVDLDRVVAVYPWMGMPQGRSAIVVSGLPLLLCAEATPDQVVNAMEKAKAYLDEGAAPTTSTCAAA